MHLIVTGASRGLGLALAETALSQAWQVSACARTEAPAALLTQAAGRLDWAQCDLAQPAAGQAWLQQVLAHCGQSASTEVLYLVLNAGVLEPLGAMASWSADALQHHLSINLITPMLLAGQFAKFCAESGRRGRVLAISSGAARRPSAHWGAYCAAKAGLDMAIRVLNVEAANSAQSERFKAVSLAPGVVDTAMQSGIRQRDFPGVQRYLDLHAAGQLSSAKAAAQSIFDYLCAADFGTRELDDIRDYGHR